MTEPDRTADRAAALEGVIRQARAAVQHWTYLRDVRVTTLGDLVSPAGSLVDLANAMFHLESHLDDLDRADPSGPVGPSA